MHEDGTLKPVQVILRRGEKDEGELMVGDEPNQGTLAYMEKLQCNPCITIIHYQKC
jgi:hypothetical protein